MCGGTCEHTIWLWNAATPVTELYDDFLLSFLGSGEAQLEETLVQPWPSSAGSASLGLGESAGSSGSPPAAVGRRVLPLENCSRDYDSAPPRTTLLYTWPTALATSVNTRSDTPGRRGSSSSPTRPEKRSDGGARWSPGTVASRAARAGWRGEKSSGWLVTA